MEMLQSMIGITYWWPESDIDGTDSNDFVTGQFRTDYLCELTRKVKLYVQAVNDACEMSATVRRVLNKPNLHRVTGLFFFTLTSFGHCR